VSSACVSLCIVDISFIHTLCSVCASCQQALQGSLVRALGTVFHLSCFKCLVRSILRV
jgi:hypothetical protein